MNLTTIHHYDRNSRGQDHDRESSYHVQKNDGTSVVVRIKVHKDKSYVNQGWARLDLWTGAEFVELFTADRDDVYRLEPWETENQLLSSLGNFLRVPFSHFDSEGALYESGHLTDD